MGKIRYSWHSINRYNKNDHYMRRRNKKRHESLDTFTYDVHFEDEQLSHDLYYYFFPNISRWSRRQPRYASSLTRGRVRKEIYLSIKKHKSNVSLSDVVNESLKCNKEEALELGKVSVNRDDNIKYILGIIKNLRREWEINNLQS